MAVEYRVMMKNLEISDGASLELTAYPTEREALDRASFENEREEKKNHPPRLSFYVSSREVV